MEIKNLNWWQKLLPPTILSFITVLFYYSSLWYGFFFDDFPTILENMAVVNLSHNYTHEFFGGNRWVSRFLNSFSYHYWQRNPFYYRILDLAMHISIGLMIYFLVLKLLSSLEKETFLKKNAYLISIVTTALFLLHPVQTQTVTYITQMRLEGSVLFFTIATLLTFTYAIKAGTLWKKTLLYILSLICISLAAGTKEIIVVLPLLIFLVDYFFLAEGKLKKILSRSIIYLVFCTVFFGTFAKFNFRFSSYVPQTTSAIDSNRGNLLTETPEEKITLKPFFISQFKVIKHYFTIFFLPTNLSFDYDYKLSKNFWDADTIFPFIFLMSILILALYLFLQDKTNFFTFGILWFFISIIPRASIFISSELACDYKTYLASFGIIFLISVLFVFLINFLTAKISTLLKKDYKIITQVSLLLIITSLYGINCKNRNFVWSSELLFWQDCVKKAPNKARLYNNLGVCYAERGERDKAIESYKKSMELDPTYAEPVINIAFNYQQIGQKELALKYYGIALNLKEVHPETYENLGLLHMDNQNFELAEICFRTALQLKPYYSLAHFNLARLYHAQNKNDLALTHFQKAIEGDIKHVDIYYSYGIFCQNMRMFDKAIELFEIVKNAEPNYKNLMAALGICYYEKRNFAKACECFQPVYQKDPNNLGFAYNYGQALLNANKFEQALEVFENCKRELHNFPYAALHIAKCKAMLGKKEEAKKELVAVLKTIPYQNVKQDGNVLLKELC